MRCLLLSCAFGLLPVFLSSPAAAFSFDDAQEIVHRSPLDGYTIANHGKLCEWIGVAVMQEREPDAQILNGVEYHINGLTIGELDLVVVKNDRAVEVVEVKCMVKFSGAAHKADDQLARFLSHAGKKNVRYSLNGIDISSTIFSSKPIKVSKMSYKDALRAGFDYDIGVTRDELLDLMHAERDPQQYPAASY